MALHEFKPNHYTVQIAKVDPLRELPDLRLCRRVAGLDAAHEQELAFKRQAEEWASQRRLIKEAKARGLTIATPSAPSSATSFADFLAQTYLPWARAGHLDPRTIAARSSTFMILAEDLGNTPLVDVENKVDALVDKWRKEGCRFGTGLDRLGRQMNRKPKSITDAGINERLKILRAILGHAFVETKTLAIRPRVPLIKKKRAAIGAGKMVRYFLAEERIRFLRYSSAGTDDVFYLGVLLGLRPDELFHARVGWVDFKQMKFFVQTCLCSLCPGGQWLPKTGRYRAIDITADLLPILRRLTKGKPDDALLIPSEHGAPYWRRVGSGGRFTRTLRRAGLDRKGLSIYSLRHTFAADLISAGKSMQEVAALLGNSVRVCEMHYGHLRPDVTRETVKVLKAVQPWAPAEPAKPARRRRTSAVTSADSADEASAPTPANTVVLAAVPAADVDAA